MSRVGDFLDQLLERKSLKQKDFARMTGMSPSHLSYTLKGNMPSLPSNRAMELRTFNGILQALDDGDIPPFLQAYLEDSTDPQFHKFAITPSSTSTKEEPAQWKPSAFEQLVDEVKKTSSPNRMAKVLIRLLKKSKGNPEYFATIEKILDATK